MWECGVVAVVYNKKLLKTVKFPHQNRNIIHIYIMHFLSKLWSK